MIINYLWLQRKHHHYCVYCKGFVRIKSEGLHELIQTLYQHKGTYNIERSNTKIKQKYYFIVCQTDVNKTNYDGHKTSLCHSYNDCNELLK